MIERRRGLCFSAMIERRMTDRREQVSPYDAVSSPRTEVTASPFLLDLLDFTVERKIKKLNRTTQSIIDSTEDSTEQLDALINLTSLIVADPRLSDHLGSKVFLHLFKFLQDKKSFEFQFYSAGVLENVLSSKLGFQFKDQAIPSLVKLIPSPDTSVQAQVLLTLTKIANKYPESCNSMIKMGTLDHLESLLTNKSNDYESLKYGGQLLTAFCLMKPHLPPDKLGKVVSIISTAIKQNSLPVLTQVCLALSILSDRRLVEIGTEVERLLDLVNDSDKEIVFCALRTIGNYVRWASDEEIQIMLRQYLLPVLGKLLSHGYTIVRKEACWIISNITAVANSSQIQERVVDVGLIDKLIRVVEYDEFEVKEVAACAILNVFSGSEENHFECIKDEYFLLLDDIRHRLNDPLTVTLCSKILELDNIYRTETSSEILKPVSPPINEEGRSSIRAHMTGGSTANLVSASAKYAQQTENATRKKRLKRRKKLSPAVSSTDSPPGLLTDFRGDLVSEVIVELSPDSSMKHLDSKIFSGENNLENGKKLSTIASLSSTQSTLLGYSKVKSLFAGKIIYQLTQQQRSWIPRSTKKAKSSIKDYFTINWSHQTHQT